MKKISKILPIFGFAFIALLFGCAKGYEPVLSLDDYIQRHKEPFLSMQKCIYAANCYPAFEHTIELSPILYKCDKSPKAGFFIDLENMRDITIDGNGAVISLDAYNSFLRAVNCENVVIKNLTITYHRSALTQGTVKEINVKEGYFLYDIDKNYATLPSDKWAKSNYGKDAWQWGCVISRLSRNVKDVLADRIFIEKIDALDNGKYNVYPSANQIELLKKIAVDDAFVMRAPIERNMRIEAKTEREFIAQSMLEDDAAIFVPKFLPNALFYACKNITLDNVHFSNVRQNAIVVVKNKGSITISNSSVTRACESDIVSSWGSAIVATDNKYGPHIERCVFDGMMEDCIDLACRPSYIVKQIDDHTYEVAGESLMAGDDMAIFYPDTGEWIDFVRIVNGGGNLIHTNRPIPNIVVATEKTRADYTATQLFNMNKINAGSVISECSFGTQRRNAIITNAHDNLITGNTFTDVGGSAIIASNELDLTCSGPLPHNLTISLNNVISTHSTPIVIGAETVADKPLDQSFDVSIIDNRVRASSNSLKYLIDITNGKNFDFSGNHFYNLNDDQVDAISAVRIGKNAKNVNFN